MTKRIASILVAVLLVSTPLLAHVTIAPGQSKLGATETYTARVPSEGGKTTTSVTLQVPDGVTVVSVSAPEGAKHSEQKVGDRVVSVTWTIAIKPGASAALSFVAKNPTVGESITWKLQQQYTEGAASSWTPATKLLPAHD